MTSFFPSNTGYVAFVYNDEKVNVFSIYSEQCTTCPTIPNNPYPVNYNSNTRNLFNTGFNDGEVETYTITAEDYQNATNCNGNCY